MNPDLIVLQPYLPIAGIEGLRHEFLMFRHTQLTRGMLVKGPHLNNLPCLDIDDIKKLKAIY